MCDFRTDHLARNNNQEPNPERLIVPLPAVRGCPSLFVEVWDPMTFSISLLALVIVYYTDTVQDFRQPF